MSLEESIIASVRRLPTPQQEQVLRFADGLQRRESSIRQVPSRDRQQEMQWINENRHRYTGQWVVVEGDRLIAADSNGQNAFLAAKAAGVEIPFLIHVLADETLPFVAGW